MSKLLFKFTLINPQGIFPSSLLLSTNLSQMLSRFRFPYLLCCSFIISYYFTAFTSANDTITRSLSIRDGETIVSAREVFELGFFSPSNSDFRYLGIWYHRIANQSIVWVANREAPISGRNGVLNIGRNGNLVIWNGNASNEIWATNQTVSSNNTIAILLDTGNFVLQERGNANMILWQSFDHPTDTYLPAMQVRLGEHGGERRVFTSWRTASDPSPGNYQMGADLRGPPQIVIWERQNRWWRSGHWDGSVFTGIPGSRADYLAGFRFFNQPDGSLLFIYSQSVDSGIMKITLTWDGMEMEQTWIEGTSDWNLVQSDPLHECDRYNYCGAFAVCSQMENPRCRCMRGFIPRYDDQWMAGNWSGGCIRRTTLECVAGEMDGFFPVRNVKLPDHLDYQGSEDDREVCERKCLENCSCTAYALVYRIGCMIWSQELVDIQQIDAGNTLFIGLVRSELDAKNGVSKTVIVIVVVVGGGMLLIAISIWLLLRRYNAGSLKRNQMPKVEIIEAISTDFSESYDRLDVEGQEATGTELAVFTFNYVAAATNNFNLKNKLGQGGFGHVYKGTLPGGKEIAVKRLSKRSCQGLEEFKNEITLIAKLQHRNLVGLLGCCIEGEERMLVYEYMPNKSLDSCLFDPDKRVQLDWNKRRFIIEGIARGLLYLHRDSRLRIIHRDLKASNILLDEEMNPKISDFGMARIFKGNQNEGNTNRVVGTYGYMAPEYAMEGLFSLKSDVYSFGVLLLEIISGCRNTSFRSTEHSNIIGYAWDLWERDRAIELVDPLIVQSCPQEQVVRCVQIGMLCVQDIAGQRPNMPALMLMLESNNSSLPVPKEPTFTSMRLNTFDEDMWNENQDGVSSNNVTVSVILGR